MNLLKTMKKVIIAAALMCSAMFLVACGGNGDYKVTVKDALGNTYGKDVIVEFYQGNDRAGMQVCDENGVASKELEGGTYTVKIKSTDDEVEFVYDEVEVTSSKREVEVVVAEAITTEPTVLYVNAEEFDAYAVNAGCTNVELESGVRNYFLFTPTEAGKYEFSVVGGETEIGYYGAPHFVQSTSAVEVVDGKFTQNIKENMIGTGDTGTTVIVIGVDVVEAADSTILCIERIGDPDLDMSDEPWDVYETTEDLQKYTLPAGAKLVDFDVTADGYEVVFNETDGYYHLNTADGPLVVMYLTADPTIPYVPCFQTILEHSGVNKYFFDENGEFVKKEDYSQCLLEYFDYTDDETGVYPLTEDLKYIVQSRGGYYGWWDSSSPNFIFKDEAGLPIADLNTDIAWLFMCAYIEQ